MASKALASPLVRHIATRGYACASPCARPEGRIQHTVLPNKTYVAAIDNGSPVTRVTIAFKAGSRYEPASELGLAHMLRSSAGLSTSNASGFIMARKLAQGGSALNASGDREFIFYTLEASKNCLDCALEQLNNLVCNQEFRPWELDDNLPRIKQDLLVLPPQVRAMDLLHKAAFRRGLGNSLFICPKRLGKISSESLQHFAQYTLTPSRCAVVVVGDSLDRANLIGQTLSLSTNDTTQPESVYYGGELRKEMGGDLAHVAIAVQGAAAGTAQSLHLAIAAKAIGLGPVTKWGCDHSALAKAIGNIGPFAAAGFNVSYSDTGLFGVILTVPKDEASKAVQSVGKLLKSATLSDDAICAGKSQLKVQVLSEGEDGTSLAELYAAQALYTRKILTPYELANQIDAVSNADVLQTYKRVLKSKLSMGSAGNLAFVPYADEIQF